MANRKFPRTPSLRELLVLSAHRSHCNCCRYRHANFQCSFPNLGSDIAGCFSTCRAQFMVIDRCSLCIVVATRGTAQINGLLTFRAATFVPANSVLLDNVGLDCLRAKWAF